MRIRIESTSWNWKGIGKYTLKKYPQLHQYKPILDKHKNLTIEITPDEIFELADELNEKIIIIPSNPFTFVSLEIYDNWRK